MKKLIAIFLAISMIAGFALVAQADEVSYTAALSYADGDWNPSTWGTDATTTVTGAGTYTVSWDVPSAVDGAVVFVIDIGDVGGDAATVLSALNLTSVTMTADGTDIPVDLSKVVTGDIEVDGQYRIEIYNEYGSTKDAPAVDTSLIKAEENISITFTLTDPNAPAVDPDDGNDDATDDGNDDTTDDGNDDTTDDTTDDSTSSDDKQDDTTSSDDKKDEESSSDDKKDEESSSDDKKDEESSSDDKKDEESSSDDKEDAPAATMNHTAGLSYADADWYPQTWGEIASVNVTGAGNYTLSWDLTDPVEGVVVFVIDIGEVGGTAAADIIELGLTSLTLTVDGKDVPVDLSKVVTGDIEEDGQYRIEIYNEYGSTKDDSPVDVSLLNASENITVNFTLGTVADSSNSKTGDSTNLIALAAAMIVAAAGMVVTTVNKKEF